MAVLQAFFDDSGSHDGSRFFVVGGYIAPLSAWRELSSRWALHLCEWNIDRFHMTDAEWRRAFEAAGPEIWDERVSKLAGLIREHRLLGLSSSIPVDIHRRTIKAALEREEDRRTKKVLSHPYALLYVKIMRLLAMYGRSELGVAPHDIEVVFAEQKKIGHETRDRFRHFVTGVLGFPEPQFRPMRGRPPLQAADMLAWLTNKDDHEPIEPLMARHGDILANGSLRHTFSESELLAKARRLYADVSAQYGPGDDASSSPSSSPRADFPEA